MLYFLQSYEKITRLEYNTRPVYDPGSSHHLQGPGVSGSTGKSPG